MKSKNTKNKTRLFEAPRIEGLSQYEVKIWTNFVKSVKRTIQGV